MIADKMKILTENNSAIRAMFEEGRKMKALYGPDNVYDFSLGNPYASPPLAVKEAFLDIVREEEPALIHGYMSNAGFEDVRAAIAGSLNRLHGTRFHEGNILMTVGAAGGMNVILKTVLNPEDEVVVFAPYFMEYGSYVRNYDGVLVEVLPVTDSFQPDLEGLKSRVTKKTKAVIINTPNIPTGVIYSERTLRGIAEILEQKQREYQTSILLISDEPYRELAYGGVKVPWVTGFYRNTAVCYSYSKSLSLPGERIGYLVIPDEVEDSARMMAAAVIANRVLGYVNAPSLIQRVILRCLEEQVDLEAYNKNRQLLYNSLKEYGFECVKPEGDFYLFVKAPEEDRLFCRRCKEHRVLVVPGSSFSCPGYVRIAYCVSYEQIERSLPAFREIAAECGLLKKEGGR